MRSMILAGLAVGGVAGVLAYELPERSAEAEGHASRPGEVQSVAFDGKGLPVTELRSVLTTHAGEMIGKDALAADRAALANALTARGYLDASVQPAQVTYDATGGVFVTFAITTGALYHVHDVRVEGATAQDTGIVTIARGDVVRAARIAEVRDAIATRLSSRGKPGSVAVDLEHVTSSDVDVVVRVN
ncbi:MAG: POTRA domain-containing protein [Kofleriaceae bacterium]